MVLTIFRTQRRGAYDFVEVRGIPLNQIDSTERLVKHIKRILGCNGVFQKRNNEHVMIFFRRSIDDIRTLVEQQLGVTFIRNDTTDPYHYVQN